MISLILSYSQMKTPTNEKAVPFKSSRYWLGEINKVGMLASLIDGLEQWDCQRICLRRDKKLHVYLLTKLFG